MGFLLILKKVGDRKGCVWGAETSLPLFSGVQSRFMMISQIGSIES